MLLCMESVRRGWVVTDRDMVGMVLEVTHSLERIRDRALFHDKDDVDDADGCTIRNDDSLSVALKNWSLTEVTVKLYAFREMLRAVAVSTFLVAFILSLAESFQQHEVVVQENLTITFTQVYNWDMVSIVEYECMK